MKEQIRQQALALGFDACRFTTAAPPGTGARFQSWIERGEHGAMDYLARNAPKRLDPQLILPGARSCVVLATSYHRQTPHARPETGPGAPRGVVARYARGRDYHDVLEAPLKALCEVLHEAFGEGTRSLWYTDTGPILERDLAQRAGIGFAGKHTNLISRSLGNWFFLSEILTTADLPPDPAETNHCGSCSRCIPACPTGAILEPFRLDARRCISYLTIELKGSIPVELRPAIGNRIFGCDDCLAACPWNRFAREGAILAASRREDLGEPGLLGLLGLTEEQFRETFRGTPMLRTKRRGLLRNVCVALGNIGGESSMPALERAASDPEPLIAEHAAWALERIRLRHRAGPRGA